MEESRNEDKSEMFGFSYVQVISNTSEGCHGRMTRNKDRPWKNKARILSRAMEDVIIFRVISGARNSKRTGVCGPVEQDHGTLKRTSSESTRRQREVLINTGTQGGKENYFCLWHYEGA